MSRTPFDEQDDPSGAAQEAAGQAGPAGVGSDEAGPELGADAGDELRKLRQERDDFRERLFRTAADTKNMQRRLQTEKEQAVQFANASLIKCLVPVIDNFERALAVDPAKADAASILKGMQMVHDEWLKTLAGQDVELIRPEIGTPFDPTRHEAVMQEASEKYTEPTVTRLFQNGYAQHGRTLRPAKVVVSKGG